MRASRLLAMLIRLQLRGRVSAGALAQEFEVSVRTIYRDMDELSAAGVPVYAERGPGGGFALLDGWRTRLDGLTASEADALALAGAPGAAQALGFGSALISARLKVEAGLPTALRPGAEDRPRRFHLDAVDWYRPAAPIDGLPLLADAVWSRRVVEIAYESWKGRVERRLDPLGLVLKAGAWYLVAAVEARPRVYRVASILALTATDDPAAADPPGFDLAAFWTEWAADFEARLHSGTARLRLSAEGLRRMKIFAPLAAAGLTPPSPGRTIDADVPIESIEDAAGWLARIGPEVEALAPPALRAALAERGRALVDLYGDRTRSPC